MTRIQQVQKDTNLDLFFLIKEKEQNKKLLSNISRDDVSEIFLFFDYDGHAPAASDDKLEKMLLHFDEETENGKLYISYPMVEALKHLSTDVDFKNIIVDCKDNISYKNIIHKNSDKCYQDMNILSQLHWKTLISEHCKKLNHLMTDDFILPTQISTQLDILKMQEKKHISTYKKVAVLSAFPLFIADYYGYSKLPLLIDISSSK